MTARLARTRARVTVTSERRQRALRFCFCGCSLHHMTGSAIIYVICFILIALSHVFQAAKTVQVSSLWSLGRVMCVRQGGHPAAQCFDWAKVYG